MRGMVWYTNTQSRGTEWSVRDHVAANLFWEELSLIRYFTRGLLVFTGFVAAPLAQFTNAASRNAAPSSDPRIVLLEQFFADRDCPVQRYAEDFVRAADTHDLDWRLLPGIAFVESGGGKAFKNNNVFGWANAEKRFASIRTGIYIVAERLNNSRLYKDKNTHGILRTYNEDKAYSAKVLRVMRLIGPERLPALEFN